MDEDQDLQETKETFCVSRGNCYYMNNFTFKENK